MTISVKPVPSPRIKLVDTEGYITPAWAEWLRTLRELGLADLDAAIAQLNADAVTTNDLLAFHGADR